jgi:putative lipoprotein
VRRILGLALAVMTAACAGGRTSQPAPPPGTPSATPAPPTPTAVAPTATPTPAPSETERVTGTVTYQLRIALTPEAVVQVELRDVSPQDVEAPLLGRQIIERPGQVPIAFSVEYDPTVIDPKHTYAVSARITDRGQLQFVTEARVPVITNGTAGGVEIVVVPLR